MKVRTILFAWMSVTIAAGAGVAAGPPPQPSPERGGSFETGSRDELPRRSLAAIRRDVHAALRAEALSRRLGQNAPEVIRLVDLYLELAAHPKRDESALVAELGLKLRSRLKDVREHIERRSDNPERNAKKKEGDLVAPERRVLAQQAVVPGGAGQGAQRATQPGAVRAIDYGPELVDLIERTISPGTWDINGGKGSVVYFAPLRVLVVSAPGRVHGQIGDVLGQLRGDP